MPRRRRATAPTTGTNVLAGGAVTDVSFVGVSTQYLVRMPWGQELMVFEQNTGASRAVPASATPVDLHWHARRTPSCSTPTRTPPPASS